MLPAGDYTITIDPSNSTLGAYALRVLNAAQATPMAFDSVVNTTLDPGTSARLYKFDAAAGEVVYFDVLSTTGPGNIYWRLIDPYGRTVVSKTSGDKDNFTLAYAGTYTLAVQGTGEAVWSKNRRAEISYR